MAPASKRAEPDDLDRFVSVTEAAERLGIGVRTARRLVAEGRFPAPVQELGGRRLISLRRLVDYINGEAS